MASKSNSGYSRATHEFPPLVFPDAEVLILGSFPSIKSREAKFFYGHPQNRFWPMLASVFGEPPLTSIEAKTDFCKHHHIALYDSIEECSIIGSSDASIKDVVPADLRKIIEGTSIKLVICNGKASLRYFEQFNPDFPCPHIVLPSTSPANAACSLVTLIDTWGKVLR